MADTEVLSPVLEETAPAISEEVADPSPSDTDTQDAEDSLKARWEQNPELKAEYDRLKKSKDAGTKGAIKQAEQRAEAAEAAQRELEANFKGRLDRYEASQQQINAAAAQAQVGQEINAELTNYRQTLVNKGYDDDSIADLVATKKSALEERFEARRDRIIAKRELWTHDRVKMVETFLGKEKTKAKKHADLDLTLDPTVVLKKIRKDVFDGLDARAEIEELVEQYVDAEMDKAKAAKAASLTEAATKVARDARKAERADDMADGGDGASWAEVKAGYLRGERSHDELEQALKHAPADERRRMAVY